MDDCCMKTALIFVALSLTAGCVQTQFYASELPARYAAKPIRDYSKINLTSFANTASLDETIQAGDRLEVNLNTGTSGEGSDIAWNVSIDESGDTSLPNIGPVRLAGLTRAEAEKAIVQVSQERDVFLTPVVDIAVEKRSDRIVFVSGAVKTPGPIKITNHTSTLADIIVRAGGLSSDASGEISVSNGRQEIAESVAENTILPVGHHDGNSFQALAVSLSSTSPQQLGHIVVSEGSLVYVEKIAPRPIQVVGVIRNQVVEVPSGQDVHLLDAVTMAGGQTYSNWISDKVTITRHVPDGNGTVRIRGSIRKARADSNENIALAPYDIVTVEENVLTFTLSTLSGLFGAGINAARLGTF